MFFGEALLLWMEEGLTTASYIQQCPWVLAILRDIKLMVYPQMFLVLWHLIVFNRTGNQLASCILSFWLPVQKINITYFFSYFKPIYQLICVMYSRAFLRIYYCRGEVLCRNGSNGKTEQSFKKYFPIWQRHLSVLFGNSQQNVRQAAWLERWQCWCVGWSISLVQNEISQLDGFLCILYRHGPLGSWQ